MASHDLIVVGGGPGGYVSAIRAAQRGLNVGIVEKEQKLGGTCLRVGCIPSKALLESSHKFEEAGHEFQSHGIRIGEITVDLASMMQRKDEVVATLSKGIEALLRKNKITRYAGVGKLSGPGQVEVVASDGVMSVLESPRILLAVGSRSTVLPGVEIDGTYVGTSTAALAFDQVPQHLVVIGGGYIGLELGSVWRRLGSRVTVLEFADRILTGIDAEIANEALSLFRKQGLDIRLQTNVTSARRVGESCVVEVEGREAITCNRVLAATGRQPATNDIGLESVGIVTDKKGCIPVNDHFQTSAAGVWAIGDCIPGPMLAHKAEEDGVACVDGMTGGWAHVDYSLIPAVVFTHPEIAAVGMMEDQLIADGVQYNKGVFPFLANGRARTINETIGKVKVLADATSDRVLGVHIIGPSAGDLIGEAAAAMNFGATAEDIARVCHAHPTLPEALKEASLAVSGQAIHM